MFRKWLIFPFRVLRFLWRFFSWFIHFLVILSLFISLLTACLALFFNLWFPSVAKWYVAHKSGFRLTIDRSNCALYRGLIDFDGIEIKNPEGKFSQEGCLEINRIMVKANLLTILSPEVILEEAVVNVKRVIYDTNRRGEINVLSLAEAFGMPKEENLEPIKKLKNSEPGLKNDRDRKKHLVKVASDKFKDGAPLRLFAIREGGQCIARKMVIYLGKIELHNATREGESKEIAINETWNFTDVRSLTEVIESIKVRLQRHSIDLVIESVFETVFNLPGIKFTKRLINRIGHFSQGLFGGIAESVMKVLPSKGDINIEDNLSKIINPLDDRQIQVSQNADALEVGTDAI